jgi:phage terminase large subunit-like protein
MPDGLDDSALGRWRSDPTAFIETYLFDPETGRPFRLLPSEREFLKHAFALDADGRLKYPELLYAAPKKSGKTTFAAVFAFTMLILYGARYAEAYLAANDFEQASSRVYEMCRRIIEASPLLMRECRVNSDRITFTATGATIIPLASDAASAAGGHPTISIFDELWGYTSERSRRFWDELVPVPTRKISARLTVSYAGFESESTLLEELHKRGLQQHQIGPNLYAGDGLLMFWSHEPVAPWQNESWLAEMRRSLRPNQFLRMIENRFVTTESSFVSMAAWDRCVDSRLGAAVNDKSLGIYVGVDASIRHDQTAIVATTWDQKAQVVRLVFHRIYQPSVEEPLDFEGTVERTLLDLKQRFRLMKVLFDPYQMMATAQRLTKAGLPIEEFPQSSPNLTAASQNLYELISSQNLIVYPDSGMRLAISRAVAVETSRGWRISKATQSHKIDVVVALAMSAHAAVQQQGEGYYNIDSLAGDMIPGVGTSFYGSLMEHIMRNL